MDIHGVARPLFEFLGSRLLCRRVRIVKHMLCHESCPRRLELSLVLEGIWIQRICQTLKQTTKASNVLPMRRSREKGLKWRKLDRIGKGGPASTSTSISFPTSSSSLNNKRNMRPCILTFCEMRTEKNMRRCDRSYLLCHG